MKVVIHKNLSFAVLDEHIDIPRFGSWEKHMWEGQEHFPRSHTGGAVLEVDKAEDVRKRVITLAESQSLVIHGYLWLICTSLRGPIDWPPLGHAAEMAERGIKGEPVNFWLCSRWTWVIKPLKDAQKIA